MSMRAQLWTLNGLTTELGRTPRVVARALRHTPPEGKINGRDAWKMTTAVRALERHAASSDQLRERTGAIEERRTYTEQQLDACEDANERVGALLEALRHESSVERRRALFRSDGRAIGDFLKATDALLEGDPLHEIHRPFWRQCFGQALGEALHLCNWKVEQSIENGSDASA